METIRRLGMADLDACLALAVDREWGAERAKWRLLLECGTGFGIDDPSGGLAATVVVMRYQPKVSVIGMVLVAKHRSREGLGRRVMNHALSLDGVGTGVCYLYATELGRPLYEQLGFVTTDRVTKHIGHWIGEVGDDVGDNESRPRPGRRADLERTTMLDEAVFGACRTPFLRRLIASSERFDVLERERDGVLIGFGVAWNNLSAIHIGPIVAPDYPAARAIHAGLATGHRLPVRVDVPGGAARREFSGWLQSHGLGSASPGPLMVFKAKPLPGERSLLYAIGSQATG